LGIFLYWVTLSDCAMPLNMAQLDVNLPWVAPVPQYQRCDLLQSKNPDESARRHASSWPVNVHDM
jgi:hypothetical protein